MIKATNLIKTGITWLPEIPSHWDLKRIKLLFDFNNNIVGKISADYSVLSLTTKGVIKRDLESGMGKFPASFDGYQIVKPNSIMLCLFDMDVTPRVVGHVDDEGIISAAYTNIIPKKDINSKYYYYYFLLQDKNKSLFALGTGIRITLDKDFFGCLKIPVPPLEVQNSIVAYLDKKNNEIDQFIRNKERLIELLEEEKQSIVRRLVTKGIYANEVLKDSNVNWIGKIPTHWTTKKIKYLGKFVSGFSFDSGDFVDEGVKVIKISNIQPMQLLWDDLSFVKESYYNRYKLFRVFKGDLVFALTRPIIKGGIKVAIVDVEEKLLINQRNAIYKTSKKLFRDWLYFVILNNDFIIEFDNQIDHTGQQPNISTNEIGNIYIPYPSIDEQKLIVNAIKKDWAEIDLVISKAQKEIDSIKEYREALITDLVTGKRSVPQLQMS